MDRSELNANITAILSGKLPQSELVIGIVGAVGANLNTVVKHTAECLEKYGYNSHDIRVSGLIESITQIPNYDQNSEYERTDAMMTAGDNARNETGEHGVLSLAVVKEIYGDRPSSKEGVGIWPKRAYIINSLKHPDEVNALRRIYGNSFYLLGVYVIFPRKSGQLVKIGSPSFRSQAGSGSPGSNDDVPGCKTFQYNQIS